MTKLINSLKVNDKINLNGRVYTVDGAPTKAKYCIMVGIKGQRGAYMVICWYPESNNGKFFSLSAMSKSKEIKSLTIN